MASFRSVLFWLHLVTGVVAGAVILLMCVTGVALTYEKQMLEWADRRSGSVPLPPDARPLPPETLLASAVAAEAGAAPTGIALRADRRAPATVTFDGGKSRLIDPYSGASLGEPSPRLRAFFRTMTNWHRWLAFKGTSRATGKAITGAANLGFLFVVLSGTYLWLPRLWSWIQFKRVLWFRRGLPGKARDFNWHNVIGIWSAVPLAIVVAGAVPISYQWAGRLVFVVAGETPPAPPPAQAARPGPGGSGGPAGPVREGQGRADRRERPQTVDVTGLDAAWAAASAQVSSWRTASARFGGPPDGSFVIAIDEGYAGQPQLRTTLTIDRASGAIVKRETFADLGPGRQLRSWLRFAHTGEIYGMPGQTVAGLVSAGGAVLVYTGLALAVRRCWAWMRRRRPAADARNAAQAA
jgi:uncharacterized iron-regulated membrane protein